MTFGLVIATFLVLGIFLYWFDGRAGQGLYRWWYKLTHKEGLPEGERRGFLVGRSIRPRITFLFVLTVLFYAVYFSLNVVNINDILVGLLGLVCAVVGTYIAGAVLRSVPSKLDKALDYVEKVESGEANLGADLSRGATDLGKDLAQKAADARDKLKEVAAPLTNDEDDATTPQKPSQKHGSSADKKEPSGKKQEGLPGKTDGSDSADDKGKPDWREGIDKYLKK